MRSAIRVLTTLALLASCSHAAGAQTIRVEVLDAATSRPLKGTFLTLLDARGDPVSSGLSDAAGAYVFRDAPHDTSAVRAELLGYHTRVVKAGTDGVDVGTVRIRLSPRPFLIHGIVADVDRRCRVRPSDGGAAARIWDEARKALETARWALEQERYWYEIEESTRILGRNGRVVRDSTVRVEGYSREPFVSRPPEELMENGFLQVEGDWLTAIAPDARVLLSDAFLDRHCFYVADREDARGVALAFEPLSASASAADIEGRILIDPETAELDRIEFRYVGSLAEDRAPGSSGRVTYDRLPSGGWIVRAWTIRTPLVEPVERTVAGRRMALDERYGTYEIGGRVRGVRERSDATSRVAEPPDGLRSPGASRPDAGTAHADEPATVEFPAPGHLLDRLPAMTDAELVPVVPIRGIAVEVEGRHQVLRRNGFYDRRTTGIGQFLDRDQIEDRNAQLTEDLLQGFKGVRVLRGDARRGVVLTGNRAVSFYRSSAGLCSPAVWMDNRLVSAGGREVNRQSPVVELDLIVRPDELEAIEVYDSPARVPTRFNVNAMCGAIVLWTRSGG